jgi:uncharacterized membrane protein YeaQ/YmgE (transglycosylase-associated protein family)
VGEFVLNRSRHLADNGCADFAGGSHCAAAVILFGPGPYYREGRKTMDAEQIMATAQEWANTVLIWIGFGTLTGLLAKAIMPGRDPGGAVATLAMGIGGTVIGCGTLAYFYEGQRVSPISPIGFIVATAGAFIILAFYRLLAGYFFTEGETSRYRHYTRRRRSRRYHEAHVEE